MLEKVVLRKFYLERHLQCPLLREREDYVRSFYEKGKGHSYLSAIANYTLRIVELLHLTDADRHLVSADDISDAAEEWAKMETVHPLKRSYSVSGRYAFIKIATDWLKRINRLAPLIEDSVPVFNELFERNYTRRKMVAAPLLKERIEYIKYWKERGATRFTQREIAVYELHIIRYLSFSQIRTVTIVEIKNAALVWAKEEKIPGRTASYSKYAEQRFVRFAYGWLRFMKCLEEEKEIYPFEDRVTEYIDHLVNVRGYANSTSKARYSILKNAFLTLGERCDDLSQVTPADIDHVIMSTHEDGQKSRKTVSCLASVLRSFFRHAEQQGWCMKNLAESIKSPRIYSGEDLPYAPKREDVEASVQYYHTDRKSAIRNYAIMQLLVVYGIRSSELTNLKLKDLNWKKEQLYLRRAKGCKPQVFPLIQSVGNAILRYLKEVRQNESRSEYVFLCMRAPYRKMSTASIYRIVSTCLKQQNIILKHYGPHSLRHGCATHLVNTGFTMKKVSDHLGHRQLDTTRIYAKVDMPNLKKVADMKWEGLL